MKKFFINIVICILIVSAIAFAITVGYMRNFDFNDNKIIIAILLISFFSLIITIITTVIVVLYKLKKKTLFKDKFVNNFNKKYVFISLIIICSIGAYIYWDYSSQKQEIKKEVSYIENVITSNKKISDKDNQKLTNIIIKYGKNSIIKNDLTQFVIKETNDYLSKAEYNPILRDNLACLVISLSLEYRDNKELSDDSDKLYSTNISGISNNDSKSQADNTNEQSNDNGITTNTSTQTQTVPSPNTSGKLTSSDGNLELENDSSSDGNVLGTIKNLSSEPYSYVEVNINLYDSNGNQVDSMLANTNNLEGNGTWKFSAPIIYPDRSQKYRVVSIEGNR